MTGRIPAPRRPWDGRRVLLGVTGGIAAYKAVQLARDLTRLGAEVDAVLTSGATEFVRPLTFQAVTGRSVHTDLFGVDGAALHIRLGVDAEAVCVAPATADFIARAAQGRADDLLTTLLLTTRAPVLICPAMNDRMYEHPQTRANLEHLETALAYRIAGPDVGPLAYGEGSGPGRMLEPPEIVERVGRLLGEDARFAGRTVLVTAGPTREPLDPVRYVGNRSSGRMGWALARAAWRRGARVLLIAGPSELDDPPGVEVERVETAREMEAAARERIGEADVSIFAAAVADYRPAREKAAKLKRKETGEEMTVSLTRNPDVARESLARRKEGSLAVGFALETEDLTENARRKLEEKGFDLLVANDAAAEDAGFGAETNRVVILEEGREAASLPLLSKDEVAERILDRIADRIPDAS